MTQYYRMLYRRASFPTRFLAEDYLVHRYVRHISSCFERTPADLFNVSMPMFLPSLMMTAEVSPSPTPALGPISIFICICDQVYSCWTRHATGHARRMPINRA